MSSLTLKCLKLAPDGADGAGATQDVDARQFLEQLRYPRGDDSVYYQTRYPHILDRALTSFKTTLDTLLRKNLALTPKQQALIVEALREGQLVTWRDGPFDDQAPTYNAVFSISFATALNIAN